MAQAQYESMCSCIILKMAVNIKDLYGNSGYRLEKIHTRMNFSMKDAFTYLIGVLLLSVWFFFLICWKLEILKENCLNHNGSGNFFWEGGGVGK